MKNFKETEFYNVVESGESLRNHPSNIERIFTQFKNDLFDYVKNEKDLQKIYRDVSFAIYELQNVAEKKTLQVLS